MQPGFGFMAREAEGTVTVSGEVINRSSLDPLDAYARLKIDNDGKSYKSADTGTPSWNQIDTGTDWVRPAGHAPGLYEVRYTSLIGAALYSATAAEDVWHSLSGGDFILVQRSTEIGTNTSTFTIEIRKDGGSVLDSASYTLAATVDA